MVATIDMQVLHTVLLRLCGTVEKLLLPGVG